ncbi:putative COPII vesicle coat protein Sec16 [Talaromyces proteolyticus]|uniref:Protein transport protein sec16 n=1 Tax=Talaromyces proteolyticus TaxID=1131652 RepID=A0AAD4KKW0_9EURO|nr:putative COPII vesicle coat protein Sec16 [Talaromyces proteolyticus]KAH8695118.1 putative COPII vesicle coat protein Sec16 [Talaromyces proteolyticus]
MADTMPPPADNIISAASWNPALRPDSSERPKRSQFANEQQPFSDASKEETEPERFPSSLDTPEYTESLEYKHDMPAAQTNVTEVIEELSNDTNTKDFSWGEDTEITWDVASPQNPFNREDIVGRTNSFPPIENHLKPASGDTSFDHVYDAEEVVQPSETQQQHETISTESPANIERTDTDLWEINAVEDDEGGFFDQLKTQTKPIYMPPEAESRFEEGIPLVENDSYSQPVLEDKSDEPLGDMFEDDDGDDFFKSAAPEVVSNPEKPSMTRKSTYDVINSLDAGALDSPVEDSTVDAKLDGAIIKEDEEDLAARWQAELDDDDDLLLEDDISKETSTVADSSTAIESSPQTVPSQPATSSSVNPYAPHQPSSSELLHGLSNPYALSSNVPPATFAARPSQIPPDSGAQSFADQSRQGYQSPYDLPDTIARPRRAPASRKTGTPPSNAMAPPPPRSISNSVFTPPPVATMPPLPSHSNITPPQSRETNAPKNFFEELPVQPSRTRPGSRSGRYTPQTTAHLNPPTQLVPPVPQVPAPSIIHPAETPAENTYQSQLQAPELIGPYSNLSVPPVPAGPGTGPRYSPKPPGGAIAGKPPISPRYSPAPPPSQASLSGRPRYASQPASLPFQPRTSSPLAHHEKIAYEAQQPPSVPAAQPEVEPLAYTFPNSNTSQPYSPPKNPFASISNAGEHARHSSNESPYLPNAGSSQGKIAPPPNDIQFAPPRRSQTQSPSRQLFGPSLTKTSAEPFQRPASVHAPNSPTKTVNPYSAMQGVPPVREHIEHAFIEPTDGQEQDPLQRWKGAPMFKFGFGGVVTTCFPRHIPRYTPGQMTPMIMSTPGEPKVRQYKDIISSGDDIVRYPGPLKTKSKKKDVVAWLSSRIAALENEGVPFSLQSEPDGYKRHDEKTLLWKLMRVLVENDGALEKSADIQKLLQSIISPELENLSSDNSFNASGGPGTYQPSTSSVRAEAVDGNILQSIKKDLLVGDREKAVWRAVDSRLWGHAMIMSSALDKPLWKQVVQEFIKREVRSVGENTESLASLYATLSGSCEESVDELVPPSARVGLQMVTKGGQGSTKNALDGLDRWRETLGLVLNNRSIDDHRALFSMGQLLASYGRTEASHICYLFARAFSQNAVFGGADDAQAAIVLLGTDHHRFPATFFRDEDAIALTEVYEFATSVLAGNPSAILPHLQPFKLQHAYILAENGSRNDAQQYCEAIGGIIKANTKPSPYFHQRLFAEIDELANRLRQAPSDGSSSWMSKPSMEKVSGSMWAKFSSFVAGDESDGASNGSAMDADVGPFAKVSGTPTVSRSPSVSDIYGGYPMAQGTNASSRYAPGNQYAPASSPEQYRGRSSMESQRSPSIGGSQESAAPIESNVYTPTSSNIYGSPSYQYHSTPPQSSYMPLAPVDENMPSQSQPAFPVVAQQSALTSGLQASPVAFGQPIEAVKNAAAEVPLYGGYEPPTSSYEPPSYQPDLPITTDAPEKEQDEEDDDEASKPKKKSFMDDDDDDDLVARASAVQSDAKSQRNRELDEAVRRAAEADAQRPAPAKKGWFGGWWGGKKDGDASGGPIRAKLGEENSFYYDPDLKKWVNKKDPNSANAAARATPPPPKGLAPQSRSASAGSTTSGPPMLQRPPSMSELGTSVDSRPSTGGSALPPVLNGALPIPGLAGPNGLPRAASTSVAGATPPTSSPGLAPPSRPATSLSTASSIDDLLGAPQARKGGTVKSKKKGRGYIDVMAK